MTLLLRRVSAGILKFLNVNLFVFPMRYGFHDVMISMTVAGFGVFNWQTTDVWSDM